MGKVWPNLPTARLLRVVLVGVVAAAIMLIWTERVFLERHRDAGGVSAPAGGIDAACRRPGVAADGDSAGPGRAGSSSAPSSRPLRASATTKAATLPADWPPPRFEKDRVQRERMVRQQISHPPDGRIPVRDRAVIAAMINVPRAEFVPRSQRRYAYADRPLPIGYGQTISQPYIVAVMTEALKLKPSDKVLEIGTGSGYQAAVLAEITPYVYTIEIIKPLARRAEKTLKRLGYRTVRVRCGDGYFGWPDAGPFDAIIVTCAAGHIPPPLLKQLKPGGRMVIPVGSAYDVQRLVLLEKDASGKLSTRTLMLVRFVPMKGYIEKATGR